jgi:hypothetical protein
VGEEVSTGTNLPAEIKIAAVDGDAYKLLFMKGGGSANKSYLYQETKAVRTRPACSSSWTPRSAPWHGRLPAVPPRHRRRRHVAGSR